MMVGGGQSTSTVITVCENVLLFDLLSFDPTLSLQCSSRTRSIYVHYALLLCFHTNSVCILSSSLGVFVFIIIMIVLYTIIFGIIYCCQRRNCVHHSTGQYRYLGEDSFVVSYDNTPPSAMYEQTNGETVPNHHHNMHICRCL